ncbi:C-type lectin domain-containing protein [Nannocystis pusilla]|uniref:C-type lectin domain-containing protein n=1 Tax=Nannocystis pusilla TaxID=889268 RepID=UPI003B82897D
MHRAERRRPRRRRLLGLRRRLRRQRPRGAPGRAGDLRPRRRQLQRGVGRRSAVPALRGEGPPGPGTAQLCFVALPFAEAEADCVVQGGHLLSIPSQEIQDWVVAEAFSIANNDWWIGLNDVDAEDDFVWTDGTPLEFTAWNEGEPNNSGEEDCVNVPAWAGGLWNDLACDAPRPYICKIP